jgi:hypothetical protein
MERRIIEGIEACRPGSDDLRQSELSDVARAVDNDPQALARYERVQAWDALIAEEFDQVAVPQGLDARILARLQASNESAHEAAPGIADVSIESHSRASRWRRRRWIAAAASVAAALLITAWMGDWLSPSGGESLEQLTEQLQSQLASSSEPWHDVASPQRAFPLPAELNASLAQWHAIGNLRGVAYRVRNNIGTATLFVLRLSATELPSVPPVAPQLTTGGKSVAYWQKGSLVYVLVVEGDQRRYRTFVSTSSTPLA